MDDSLALQAIDYALTREDGLVWLQDWRAGDAAAVEELDDHIGFQAMARMTHRQIETEGRPR